MSRKVFQKKRTKSNSNVWDRWSKHHVIFRIYSRKQILLPSLKPNESVVCGNMKDYYYLLVKNGDDYESRTTTNI
jgi:hypothetical protein